MIKSKIEGLADEISSALSKGTDNATREASNIISDMGSGISDFFEFIDGRGGLQEWIENNRLLEGRPFSYKNADVKMEVGDFDTKLANAPRPYLTQYINDPCHDKSVIKCRQSEFTVNEINENIYLCATRPYTNVSHIFPTGGMAEKMAREKISVALEKSPRIARLIRKPFSIRSKTFLNSSIYTVDSSYTDYQGRGPSRDKITFDEYEIQNPQIEDIYSESTSHSPLGKKTRISTPKFPDSGIDGRFKKGCVERVP